MFWTAVSRIIVIRQGTQKMIKPHAPTTFYWDAIWVCALDTNIVIICQLEVEIEPKLKFHCGHFEK